MKKVIAIDLGASSGRLILVSASGGKISFEEIYRFKNEPVELNGRLYWDLGRIYNEILNGLNTVSNSGHGDIDSIGIDTWGVDYGLLDRDGDLIGMPYHYRDRKNLEIGEYIDKKVGLEKLYMMSGIQNIFFNTSFQFSVLRREKPELLKQAKYFLMMPDLIAYFLTGEKHAEFTASATTQLYDLSAGKFDADILRALDLPEDIYCPVIYPGQTYGILKPEIAAKCGLREGIPIIATAGHDTASAVTAVPAESDDFAFVSCGTWSLMGSVIDSPIKTPEAYRLGFSNEGMTGGKIKFLKNIMGLWIIQESRNTWRRKGNDISFDELERAATEAEPFVSFIDVEDERFANPPDMPQAIRDYCAATGQPVPETIGQIMRCAYESIAMKYRFTCDKLTALTGKTINTVHIIGGGCRDRLLCRMSAESTGKRVVCGPNEATAVGNAMTQLTGLGEFSSLSEARKALRASIETNVFEPSDHSAWDEAYKKYLSVIGA